MAQAKKKPKSLMPLLGRTANKMTPIKDIVVETAAPRYN